MVATPTVYNIPETNWETLTQRIEKLTRRAKKLGKAVPVLTKVGEHDEVIDPKKGLTQKIIEVTIDAEPVCVNGWTFVASIDIDVDVTDDPSGSGETQRIINRVPGVLQDIDLPANYRTTNNYCDHCQSARRRNSVYIVKHDVSGEWRQIGRNCLGQFLGGVDPKDVVANMELLINLDSLCSGAQGYDFFGFGRNAGYLDLHSALVFTGFLIKKIGWLGRAKARELALKTATADYVQEAYFTPERDQSAKIKELVEIFADEDKTEIESLDKEAFEAMQWIRSTDDEQNNDYLHNLYVACSKDSIPKKYLGLVCSLLVAHKNTMQKALEKREKPISKHVGVVGMRQTFYVKVKNILYWNNNFGVTTAIFFEDKEGNSLIWKASKDPQVEKDLTYEITGKVKKHDNYKGNNQTELSHCKIIGAIGAF